MRMRTQSQMGLQKTSGEIGGACACYELSVSNLYIKRAKRQKSEDIAEERKPKEDDKGCNDDHDEVTA